VKEQPEVDAFKSYSDRGLDRRSEMKPGILSGVQETQSGVQRLSELDALRGLAALSVVLWHFFCATYTQAAVWPIYWVSRGDGAVVLFFILSGFVLSLPFQRPSAPAYATFVIRRICRIYLPYLAGIGLSLLIITFVVVAKVPGLSPWFNAACGVPFDGRIALEHLFLIGNIHSNSYNNPVWSLVQEMRVSLLFPLLFWLVHRMRIITNLIVCGVLSAISEGAARFNLEISNGYQTGYFFTAHVVSLFIIGILLAQHREGLVRQYQRMPRAVKYLVLLSALILYRLSMEWRDAFPRDYGSALGAVVFLVFALGSGKVSALLRQPLLTFLGNISYAMYLNHLSVIYLVMFLCYPAVPLWPLCLIVVALTLLLSFPFWKFIERPAIALGRFIVRQPMLAKPMST
jgi:peptidoglycan/LPS O-acetylase OafA/YrhL